MSRARIAVLVSGGGTNLQALIDAQQGGAIPSGELVLVIANRADAYALRRAESAGIDTAVEQVRVRGISHITGGGFYENIPRSIPDGLGAKIDKAAVRVLPIFDLIAKVGGISERDMFNTFNMGVGMSIVVPADEADKALAILRENGEDAYVIGEIVESDEKVIV